tara:strand:+ start:3157 stop:4257 length:1101 start_codon:yes stop_codon:yes gene_type:complete
MTELKVDTVVDLAGTGKPNFSTGVTINTAALSTLNLGQYAASGTEPSSPENGSVWWDSTNEVVKVYIAGEWKETVGISSAILNGGVRGFAFGGDNTNVIEYFDITSAGNATDFGDMTNSGSGLSAGVSNLARIVMSGAGSWTEQYDYITCATTGNATNFGSMANSDQKAPSACGDGTRGVFISGITDYEDSNAMEYITIATTGNATNFGNQTVTNAYRSSCADATRGLTFGGQGTNVIEYITIQTTGNATDFGDTIYSGVSYAGATADKVTGFHIAGNSQSMKGEIHKVTIQTLGNATDFGDLATDIYGCDACCDGTYACVVASTINGTQSNNIERFTTATAGNASDFGDCTVNNEHRGSASGNAS